MTIFAAKTTPHADLDPPNWKAFRDQGHRMLDDILNYIENIQDRPVWQPIPDEVRTRFRAALPIGPSKLSTVHDEFMNFIAPYSVGNVHPGFMGWVHGGGNVVGVLAEMLAAGLNANVGGRDQAPVEVERQVVNWMRAAFDFPAQASGLLVTGTSMANLIGVLVARSAALGPSVRQAGVRASARRLTAYASSAAHGCVGRAMDFCGLGSDALRAIPTNDRHQIDPAALENAIMADRAQGLEPFLIVGTAGTVDIGAIDDLAALASVAHREKLWFHVDGAFGALGIFADDVAPRLRGIQQADSIALDFHKWGQVPYDAGFVMVRDGDRHREAFEAPASYLQREKRGLAAGSPWPCDLGPDLSRGFRALKVWFTLKVYGTAAIGGVISRTCEVARYCASRISQMPELQLMAAVQLNIVCFRYRGPDVDRLNRDIVIRLQESGIAVPSTTLIAGQLAIRAAIVNHRTEFHHVDAFLDEVLVLGRALTTKTTDLSPRDVSRAAFTSVAAL